MSSDPSTDALVVYKGAAVSLACTMWTDSTKTVAQSIVGWTLVFTLRRRATNADPALLTIPAVPVNAAAGTYAIPFTHAQLNALTAGVYAYDIQRTDAGSESPVAVGRFQVKQEVLYP
jgi:hypothetical protein